MPKRRCIFNTDLQKKYPYIQKTFSDVDVQCNICQTSFNISASGKSQIDRHLSLARHKKALNAASSSRPVNKYFAAKFDQKLAAVEGVWAYHVVKANHSSTFASSDCASKILRTCSDVTKFHCARTRCEAIAVNVLAPYSNNVMKAELEKFHYVCVSVDASNCGNIKLMPVVVRYFLPTIGVRIKMLAISSEKGETSLILTKLIKQTIENYQLNDKFVGLCGENCATNFENREHGGVQNVYACLKPWKPDLIGIDCATRIVHNALKSACDTMPFDVECVVDKIFSEFYFYNTRVEALKEWCDFIDGVDYSKFFGYGKTRFLTLGPAIKSILNFYDALEEYFLHLDRCPKTIKFFFENPFSKMWLYFILSQVSLFIETMNHCRTIYFKVPSLSFFLCCLG